MKIINENSDKVRSVEKVSIIKQDAIFFLKKTTEHFDLILADPPYQFKQIPEMINLLIENFRNTQIVLETSHNYDIPDTLKELNPVVKIYGNTKLTIFKV